MLAAAGLTCDTQGQEASPYIIGDFIIAAAEPGEINGVGIRVLALAYDTVRDTYFYCGILSSCAKPTYRVTELDHIIKPTVKSGEKIKHLVTAETVLTYKITKVEVIEDQYQYSFDIERPNGYAFTEEELLMLKQGHAEAERKERKILGKDVVDDGN